VFFEVCIQDPAWPRAYAICIPWSGACLVLTSPSELGKDRSFRGCALRYLGCTLHMLDAGVAELAKPAERGSEGEEECEDDMRDRRDS
jgi:hypothetical protein